MRQVHRPASGDHLICQPRCPAARFNGRLHAHAFPAAPPNGSYHGSPIIGAALIEQHLAVARHDTHLHRRRVIIQTDKHRFRGYTAHACCSWHKGNGTHTLGLPGQQALSSPSHWEVLPKFETRWQPPTYGNRTPTLPSQIT